MTEKEEKKKEMKNQIKEENKPSLWQRMKKPLAAGLLSASLLFTPVKRADAITMFARPPPENLEKIVEKDKLLKIGWQILIDYWNGKRDEKDLDLAKRIFENVYKKTKNPIALYLDNLTIHFITIERKRTYRESKEEVLKALKVVEERLNQYPDDIYFLAQKQMFLKAIFKAAYDLYFNKEEYKEERREDEVDLYYKDAIEFGKKLIEFEKKLLEINQKDYFSTDPKETDVIFKKEKDEILRYLEEEISKNEKLLKNLEEIKQSN